MHWADQKAGEIISSGKHEPFWVDDMKTPSGFSHIGSLMGPILHSMVFRALKDAGEKPTFTFVINDFDPADDLLPELRGKFEKYLGMPLKVAPSPDPRFESMADLFGSDFIDSIRSLGVEAEILSSWKMYHEGKFDEVIKMALDNSEKIQDIYQKVSGSAKKEKGWLPFQVICENCGKLGTTRVFDWDGEKVSYKCEPSMVKWAEGCGHEGKISPFGGNGKLPWKVDWAAHWKVIGVTVEGAGKDHASAGGSYDIAMTICREVFKYPEPFKMPYEFVLIGGRKMSSSKGLGIKAHDLVKIVPPELGRFLYASRDIRSQSNFDPNGTNAIPDLFDEYDHAWGEYLKGTEGDMARAFVLSQIKDLPPKDMIFLPRFREVATYLQQPNLSIIDKFSEVKGSELSDTEKDILEERVNYAKVWLEKYAPKENVTEFSESVPEIARDLNESQKKFLKEMADIVEKEENAEKLQTILYDKAKNFGLSTKDAFSAIYMSLIGKTHGPKAAWLILEYPRKKVVLRLKEVSKI